MRRLLTTSLVLLLSMPPAFMLADEAPSGPPAEGDRIRLKAPGVADRTIIGRLLRADQSALAVTRDDGSVVDVPRSAIQELEVVRGRRSHAKTGAAIGAAAMVGVVLATPCDSSVSPCDAYSAVYAVFFGLLGAAVGAGIGKMIKTDRWVKVDPGRVEVAVAPMRRGVAFGVSVRF